MDASDITRKKIAKALATIKLNLVSTGPNNPPLTPGQLTEITASYPKTPAAGEGNLFPCGTVLCPNT